MTSQPVQQQLAPLPPPSSPTLGWAAGWLAKYNPAGYKRAISRVADKSTDLTEALTETAYVATGLKLAPPDKRWEWYTQGKTPALWALQRAKKPSDWEEDRRDLEKLADKALAEGRITAEGRAFLLAQTEAGA